jgi:hypothetical protein
MPYIKQEDRDRVDPMIDVLAERIAKDSCDNCEDTAGRLNYTITKLMHKVLEYEGCSENYSSYNNLIGMLECARMELYRRKVAPYEDKKINENGDV